jgi:hypothetical protein
MPQYRVRHRYSAVRDGQRFGPWAEGDRVELTEVDAAWVNRDSDGALTLADAAPEAPAKSEAPAREERRQDRQHRPGQRRNW